MKKVTAIILGFVLVIFIANCSKPQKKITLTFKYKPEMVLSYEQTSKRQTKVFAGDSLVNSSASEYKAYVEQTIVDIVNDTTYKINEQDTWVYTMPSKTDSTVLDTVESIRNMELLVLKNGKIVEFILADSTETKSSYLKNYYEQGIPVFPSTEVHTGYSWTQTTSVVLPKETMTATSTYTVNSIVREMGYDCVIIEYTGNLLIPIEAEKDDITKRSGVDRIKTTGMIYFAYKEGIVIKQTEKWTTSGDRIQLSDEKWEKFNFVSDNDVIFTLKSVDGLH